MSTFCEDRVAIVTGAGRGIGREYALMLAEHGAKVVVNDMGGARDGSGADLSPAEAVVAEIESQGGQACANGADVSDFQSAQQMVQQALESLRPFGCAGQQRRHFARPHAREYAGIRMGRRNSRAPEGHLRALAPRRRLLARRKQGRAAGRCAAHQHHLGIGHLRQPRAVQLRRGQGGHCRIQHHRLARARPLRRHRQLHCAGRAYPAHRRPAARRNHRRHARGPEPRAGSRPIVTWLASRESADVTGRIFESSGGVFAVAESWNRGPSAKPVMDPTALGPIVRDMVKQARLNTGMNGNFLDGGLRS